MVESHDHAPSSPPMATIVPAPRRWSLFWLLPIALLIGLGAFAWMQVSRERGPRISIVFDDAAGLEPGADIVHRGISVGVVRRVGLTPDLTRVRVVAELSPTSRALAREGAQFWIVRPQVSLERVEGLETLIGPRYIAVRPAEEGAPFRRRFEGASAPPDGADAEGLFIQIKAANAASITPGSPVLYRGIRVGTVGRAALADDATGVLVEAVIDRRYAPIVRENTRFWNAGGVGVDFGLFRGLTVSADSVETVLQGAIAMATPTRAGVRVGNGHVFDMEPAPKESWLDWAPSVQLAQ
ncbi:MAG: MlaD family protein [Planctomycetota bacterium]